MLEYGSILPVNCLFEEEMKKKTDNKKKIYKQLTKIIAIVCVVGFAVVFLFSAIHFTAYSDSSGSNASPCQRTLMPECRCESGATRLLSQPQLQSHVHNGAHTDCFVCVIIHKTVSQTRQLTAAVADIIHNDISFVLFAGLFVLLIAIGLSSPVKLKTRTNN